MGNRTLTFLVDGASVGHGRHQLQRRRHQELRHPGGRTAGSHTVTVTFPAEANYNAASGTGTLTVTQTAAATTLSVANVSTAYYQPVTLTATLTAGGRGRVGQDA